MLARLESFILCSTLGLNLSLIHIWYWVIGKVARPITPKITSRMEITVDSTGRLINLSNFIS